MGLSKSSNTMIGNPAVFTFPNVDINDLIRFVPRQNNILTHVWTANVPDYGLDYDPYVKVEFDDFVTITGLIIQGGLTPDLKKAFVSSFSIHYLDVDGEWIKLDTNFDGNTNPYTSTTVVFPYPISTRVRNC